MPMKLSTIIFKWFYIHLVAKCLLFQVTSLEKKIRSIESSKEIALQSTVSIILVHSYIFVLD